MKFLIIFMDTLDEPQLPVEGFLNIRSFSGAVHIMPAIYPERYDFRVYIYGHNVTITRSVSGFIALQEETKDAETMS